MAPLPSKTIEDKDLISSIVYMKQNNFLKESKAKINFETVKEAEDYFKEEVYLAVKETLNNLKQDISELQKKGYELRIEGIKLLEVPLKLKVWKASLLKKDLENIYGLLNSVSKITDKLKKEQEEKEKKSFEKEKADDLTQRAQTAQKKAS